MVSNVQLRDAGFDRAAIHRRLRAGRLHRIHRCVYAVGHAGLSVEGRWMAAVLACGDGAVLSHRAAAAHLRLLRPVRGPVEVTIHANRRLRRQPGIRLHRSRTLTAGDIASRSNIPVTTAARTIADLRRVVPPALLRSAIREAAVIGLEIPELEADHTRSELERRFLRLCRRHRLPAPQVNAAVGSFTVDFLWPERRLVVETDGYRFHGGRQAFEDDRARDVQLRLRGYEIVRFTHRQLNEDAAGVAAAVRALLQARE